MSDGRIIRLAQHPHRARTDPGGALRAAREQSGLDLRDFAAALAIPGIGPDAIRAFEEGHARPPQSVIDAASRLPHSPTHEPPTPPANDDSKDDAELAARSLIYHDDAASALRAAIDLGRNDMRRREAILKASYGIAALCIPSRDWLISVLERGAPERSRIGMSEIDGMRKIFAAFQEMDVCGGGGVRAREALVSYFNDRVAPLLDLHHKPAVRRALFQAASEQTYLAGWMAYEAANHGLAERYLIQSLRLAQESGDTLLGAHVLAGMSDQATLLGHPHEGLKLAKTGQHGLRRHRPTAALADLYTLEARAHAALGHRNACLAAIQRAENAFDQIEPENEPEWARFIDVPYLWGEFTNCARDLKLPDLGATFAKQSIGESARQRRARRGALSTYGLAISHLQRGEIDTACYTAQQALTLSHSVQSVRLSQALHDFEQRIAPHRHEPAVAAFTEHAYAHRS
jgi:tetratricopeptide (TPR) repeat protein